MMPASHIDFSAGSYGAWYSVQTTQRQMWNQFITDAPMPFAKLNVTELQPESAEALRQERMPSGRTVTRLGTTTMHGSVRVQGVRGGIFYYR